ncbi:protein FAM83F-like [Thunnus maccoyii]|uniref:protein FAM83F-like n=1 Tax=Thunnus maccoyii TaxID=8240 RepID=UPI001C4D9E0E|nr:protein FAM83F-like [Thunnus maccoyii]
MAESQLVCMEDGHIGAKVPDTKPEFYYSEEQRAAVEELLRNGDGAFKTRLKDDNMKDFLSAREIKLLTGTFKRYDTSNDSSSNSDKASPSRSEQGAASTDADSGVHSTYWPQMSDTEVPPLDIGWPSGGLFKGVTRVAVHTHPPKDNGPHIKEVVRRLIQEASKVIAIVMDMLTDIQILQDLMDAAWRRSVPIYILLDEKGVPHFLDMCSRLQIGVQHLRNIRARTLQGTGFGLSFGRLPGSLCNKYMLVDGDKVMFGSYSFSWCTSRMDRNMITVMTGQVVDFFDRDFRELYAISEKMDLYKEFHVSPPAKVTATIRSKTGPKRPPLPATTSRFQVSLGDSRKADIQVPAHKYYNPKYSLAFGDTPRPTGSLQQPGPKRGSVLAEVPEDMDPGRPRVTSSEKMDRPNLLPSEAPSEIFKRPNGVTQEKKQSHTRKQKFFRGKSSSKLPVNNPVGSMSPSPTETNPIDENEDNFEVIVKSPSKRKNKKPSKLGQRTDSGQTVTSAQDNESFKRRHQSKQACKVS